MLMIIHCSCMHGNVGHDMYDRFIVTVLLPAEAKKKGKGFASEIKSIKQFNQHAVLKSYDIHIQTYIHLV